MTIHIDINDSHEQQLQHCRTYISDEMQECIFDGSTLTFLPPSAITTIATLPNIQAFVAKDPGLAAIKWPTHSRQYLNNKIAKFGRRMFVATVSQGLGMKFLRDLMNEGEDPRMPFPDTIQIKDKDGFYSDTAIDEFLEGQEVVCAPVFTLNSFHQTAPFTSSLPFLQATLIDILDDGRLYTVRFHREHLKSEDAHVPSGIERKLWVMKVFPRELSAAEVRVASKRPENRFGFYCENKYYLISEDVGK